MEDKYLLVKEKLTKYNQEHLLKFYNELTDEEKGNLLEDILKIDFEQVQNLFEETKKKDKFKNDIIEPIEYIDKEKMTKEEINYYNRNYISYTVNAVYFFVSFYYATCD